MIADIAIPALVALVFKLLLLGYSAKSPVKSGTTRLYVALLLVLALHNLIEFLGLNYFSHHGLTPTMQRYGFAYVALLIPAIALILHVSLRLSFDLSADDWRIRLYNLLYVPAAILLYLLLGTDRLVRGFQLFQNSVLRVPGPLYFLFETYLSVYLLAALANLIYGARSSRVPVISRTRNRFWLLAVMPSILLLVFLIVAHHFGWTKLTSTVYLPMTLTFFLAVTAYATHQYRLFDVAFFVPWSEIRRRKMVFYQRVQQVTSEIADLDSAKRIIQSIAAALNCPIALIGGPRPVLSQAGDARGMGDFPTAKLQSLDRIVIANEIAEIMPETHALMKRRGVAAIVPFHPHSAAASWLLLGESFSELVYTPRDFLVAEGLFHRLADQLLDKQLLLRSQLAEMRREVRALNGRLADAQAGLEQANKKLERLTRENNRLRERETASLNAELALVGPEMLDRGITGCRTLDAYAAELERRIIVRTLEHCDGNRSKAAEILGLRPNTLHYKMERYGLERGRKSKGQVVA